MCVELYQEDMNKSKFLGRIMLQHARFFLETMDLILFLLKWMAVLPLIAVEAGLSLILGRIVNVFFGFTCENIFLVVQGLLIKLKNRLK